MNTCGNCKFKGDFEKSYDSDDNEIEAKFFTCKRVVQKPSGFDWTSGAKEKAYVQDGSGYYAALLCTDDFGCTLFEAKNAS